MLGFYFSSVPKLKIRRGWVVNDISPPPPVPSAASVLGVTILQTPETMIDSSSFISPVPGVISGMSSASFPTGPVPSSENSRQSSKRKAGANSRKEAFRTPVPPPAGIYEYINIGSRRDKLDPTVLRKLPAPTAIAAASVHKYWTSTFGKAVDNAELTELLKLAEMYTSQSHVLNCELYKVLAMKVDELCSTVETFESALPFPKTRGHAPYMISPKLIGSRVSVFRLRRRSNCSSGLIKEWSMLKIKN
ncbi:hypothetical protein Fot_12453 [Forsythia ovata]|uniref:Uncharacterized protein n=1 Tax=Forsythia ovata TaxID=205694 RepID=A0ABD1WQH3_9LAMI